MKRWVNGFKDFLSEAYRSADMDIKLMDAASKGRLEETEWLLDQGARLDSTNNIGATPLHVAVLNERPEIVKLLLERGAPVNAVDKTKETPLHYWAVIDGLDLIAKLLSGAGAEIDAINMTAETPLYLAAKNKNLESAKLLLDLGASVDGIRYDGLVTPLQLAAFNGEVEMVELLLDRGAVIDAPDNRKWTALARAVHKNHPETARLLILRGANPALVWGDVDGCKSWFGDDLSWLPGGESALQRKFKATEIRKKLF